MTRSLSYCALAYVAAFAAAWGTAVALSGAHPLWIAFCGDVAATVVVFGFSLTFNNSSLYDPYWSVAPVPLAAYFALRSDAAAASDLRTCAILVLVTAWAIRLTYNFLRGWQGLAHEDWRYVDIRQKTGRAYWLVSFLGIHLFPTLMVFAGCLPVYAALMHGTRPLNLLDVLAVIATVTAIAIEALADEQLRRFRLRTDRSRDEIMASGLWAWSRHPNYLGEMLFWWGLFLFALAAAPGYGWTALGAAAISTMFNVVSVRLLEARMLERRPHYAEHVRRIPAFLPSRRPAKPRAS